MCYVLPMKMSNKTEKLIYKILLQQTHKSKLTDEQINQLKKLLVSSFNEWIADEIKYFLNELEKH